jgi:SAM-dependent methyltransferase
LLNTYPPMENHKFSEWLAAYTPISGEILDDTYSKSLQGMSYTELHAYRYRITLQKLMQFISLRLGDRILDIGPYPGGWASLLNEYYERQLEIDLIGLGMTPEFRNNLNAANIHFIDFDIDCENPICKNPGQEIPLASSRYRAVSMLEAIEHLFNPLPVLHKIKESLAEDGVLILTTDNPSWFGFAYQILRYRRSPWGSVQESHVFNKSDWRPHIHLYNLQDLTFLLEHAGMQIRDSSYFNDHFGLYALKNGKLKFRFGIKALLAKLLSLLLPAQLWANRIMIVAERKTEKDCSSG